MQVQRTSIVPCTLPLVYAKSFCRASVLWRISGVVQVAYKNKLSQCIKLVQERKLSNDGSRHPAGNRINQGTWRQVYLLQLTGDSFTTRLSPSPRRCNKQQSIIQPLAARQGQSNVYNELYALYMRDRPAVTGVLWVETRPRRKTPFLRIRFSIDREPVGPQDFTLSGEGRIRTHSGKQYPN